MSIVVKRKTDLMLVLELRHRKDIDSLILERVRNSQGELRAASVSLDISESVLSRWIEKLGLQLDIARIRMQYGRAVQTAGIDLDFDGSTLVRIIGIAGGKCEACGLKLPDLEQPIIMEDITQSKHPKRPRFYLVLRDGSRRRTKHWFYLPREKLREYARDFNEDKERERSGKGRV